MFKYTTPELIAIHHGYPKDNLNFVKREIWHGTSDFISVKATSRSKFALISLSFTFLHALLVLHKDVTILSIFSIATLMLLLSWKKYFQMPFKYKITNSIIFYFHFLGRKISFFKAILIK